MLFSLHLLCRKWLNVWLLCCQFDGQTGRFSSLLLSLTEIFCKDSKVEKKPHLVPRVWMSGCWHESVCYTDADSLTSGGLRLLTDTKDTSTLAQPHAPSWMLSFLFFFFLLGLCSFPQVERRFLGVSLRLPLRDSVFYSLTQRMFSTGSCPPASPTPSPSPPFVSYAWFCCLG